MRYATIGLVLSTIFVSGCAWIGQTRVTDSRTEGRVDNNIYTSPRQSFRMRLPWLAPGAKVQDQRPTPYTTLVIIEDQLCREFIVSERPGYLGTQSLQSWVDENIIEDLSRLGFKIQSQVLTTPNGPAIALRYQAPAAAPCGRPATADGKPDAAKLDADVAWQVYYRDGAFYRLIYTVGIGPTAPSFWYINREPVDEVLKQFAAGFEILDVKDRHGEAD